jgi:Uma2 family endonuclease
MTVLTIPPKSAQDTQRAKDFLFEVYGERLWSEKQYLELSDQINRLIELSEGRLIVPPMPTPDHQDLVGNLYMLFRIWARNHKGKTYMSPMPVRLWPRKFREPDVMLYSAEHRDRIKKQYAEALDLAVEVLSPGTEKTDMDEKMEEYARAGITEYWVVAVDEPHISQYVLDEGQYRLSAEMHEGDIVRAVTLSELEVAVDEIYRSE